MDKSLENLDIHQRLELYRYTEIPCAHCGLHYWKIPTDKGTVKLICPKCKKQTKVEIGEQFRIEPN